MNLKKIIKLLNKAPRKERSDLPKTATNWYHNLKKNNSLLEELFILKEGHYSEKEHKGEGYGPEGQFLERRIEEMSAECAPMVKKMKGLIRSQDWTAVRIYKQELTSLGYSDDVIQKWIIAPAMHGLRF